MCLKVQFGSKCWFGGHLGTLAVQTDVRTSTVLSFPIALLENEK